MSFLYINVLKFHLREIYTSTFFTHIHIWLYIVKFNLQIPKFPLFYTLFIIFSQHTSYI
jgi:hypothetical protein